MRKVKLYICIFTLSILFGNTFAYDQFRTKYNIEYRIEQDTNTRVSQEITIENLKDDVIATNYTLGIKQLEVTNITAQDFRGEMDVTKTQENDTTVLTAVFNENVIGKGRENTFTFSYETSDITNKVGEIYNITIPKVAELENIKEYNITLIVPKSFGPKLYVTPQPESEKELDNNLILEFDKEMLTDNGISASFGKYQTLNYKLTYQLKNDLSISTIQEIALPPDIEERQQVNHQTIEPEPFNVYLDEDNNLIAQYKVKPNSELSISVIGSAKITGKQINPNLGGDFSNIPAEITKKYTKEQPYWETNSTEIQTLKNKLYDRELNVTQNAQKIYNYVVDTLNYDFETINKDYLERSGAKKALLGEAPAACMEFTDLFITIARAMGIPSREINGYAINTREDINLPLSIRLKNGDLLHAWPEFYDPNFGWIQIDPTWGHTSGLDFFTKLDTNHLAFAIKGTDSSFPLPAGMYRYNEGKQLVSVEIAQEDTENTFNYSPVFKKVLNTNLLQALQGNRKYLVKNMGGTYIYNLETSRGPVDLLPNETKVVFINKNIIDLPLSNFNGENINIKMVLTNENIKSNMVNPFVIVLSLLFGSIIAILVINLRTKIILNLKDKFKK